MKKLGRGNDFWPRSWRLEQPLKWPVKIVDRWLSTYITIHGAPPGYCRSGDRKKTVFDVFLFFFFFSPIAHEQSENKRLHGGRVMLINFIKKSAAIRR